ncbi:MAG: hypothetical protein IJZ42_12010 [Lachnospiraceae bacterium]|nr:hypothetical protein [Lachnospiraceae bacterium]
MEALKKAERFLQSYKKVFLWIGGIVLALLPFLHVNSGVEFTDTGYSLGNYEHFADAEGTWALATFLANVTGWFFTKLPMGHTMLGMQIYCNAVLSILLVVAFVRLKEYFPARYVFAGEVLAWALCWCPRVILYNYLTYFCFAAGCFILIHAIKTQKKKWFFIAGIVLGISLFVRFSNLTQAALIVVVLYDAFLRKKSVKSTMQCVGICIAGYMSAVVMVLGGIALFYGGSEYFTMIQSLFAMKDTESTYSVASMVIAPLRAYAEQLKWIWVFPVITVLGMLIYRFCKKPVWKYMFSAGFLGTLLAVVLYFYKIGVFWRNYNDYHCFKLWAVAFVLFSLGLALYIMFSKTAGQLEKCIACMVIVVIAITPLGSNNALYPVYNNLFLVAPFTFAETMKYIGKSKNEKLWPMKLTLTVMCTIFMIQSLLFGWVFTFRDDGFTRGIDTTITENRVLAGMRTTKERARQIEELSNFVYENELCGREVLLYGEIPFAVYALEMKSALSSSWADLDTVLNKTGMQKEMEAMESEPVIIIAADVYPDLLNNPETDNEKALLIADYLTMNAYGEVFRNDKFVVYLPTE